MIESACDLTSTVSLLETDTVVFALYVFWYINDTGLWIEFGKRKGPIWLLIHPDAEIFGERVCRTVIFLYARNGWDTLSQF